MVYSPLRLRGFTPVRVPSLFQTTRKAQICLLSSDNYAGPPIPLPSLLPPPHWLHWPPLTLRLTTEVSDTSLLHAPPPNSMGTYQAFCKVPLGQGETETLPSPAGGRGGSATDSNVPSPHAVHPGPLLCLPHIV